MITLRKLKNLAAAFMPLSVLRWLPVTGAIVMAVTLTGATLMLGPSKPASAAGGCDTVVNEMMTGGFDSPGDFIDQINNGDSSGHDDLGAIYAAFGLDPGDYNAFVSSAKEGVATRSGDIIVDGQTVATGNISFGRQEICQGTGPQSMTIGDTTIWGNVNEQSFAQGADNLKVTVLFNNTGAPIFVALNSCGNPNKFTPIQPEFGCDLLQKHPVDGQKNTFTFTTQAHATNNASITKVVYDFGDGSDLVTEPDGDTPTPPHTFTQSSIVRVTVFVNVPGHDGIPVTSEKCKVPIVVEKEKPVVPPVTPPVTPPAKTVSVVVPTVMPNTGAGDVLPLAGGAVAAGTLGGRWLLLRKRRTLAVDNQ